MSENDRDLRTRERFVAAALVTGTFAGLEVSFENMSLGGVEILHTDMLRIGLRARLDFRGVDTAVSLHARVAWSHLSQDVGGTSLYRSGLKLEEADAHYALALNELIRKGALIPDRNSMDRKLQRTRDREEKRRAVATELTPDGKPLE